MAYSTLVWYRKTVSSTHASGADVTASLQTGLGLGASSLAGWTGSCNQQSAWGFLLSTTS